MEIITDAVQGHTYNCPPCEGLIWVNMAWPGLPMWDRQLDGSLDRPFRCPWCRSTLLVGPSDTITTLQTNFNIRHLRSSDLILISEAQLSILLSTLLRNVSIPISDSGKFVIGKPFDNEGEFKIWCSGVTGQIRTGNKLVRLPVLDI